MSTALTWQTTSTDSAATIRFGESLGARLRGGELIELVSDVGGGKTTLVKGIVKGAGSQDQVASPSFTISREYKADTKTIYHLDFYRLQDPGVVANELAEFLDDERAVTIIEWAGIVEALLPPQRMQIKITVLGPSQRQFQLTLPQSLQYLLAEEA